MRNRLLVPAALLLFVAGSAGAQLVPKPLSFTIFGGAAMPTGDAGNALNTGWLGGVAMDLHVPVMPLGVRLEGSYARFGVQGLSGTGVTAHTSDLGINLNRVMTVINAGLVKPYLTAGPSFSSLKVSASDGTNSDSAAESHYGFNAGGGVDFGLGGLGARVDLRYKRISTNGSAFTTIPLTFGIRF